MVVSGEDFKDFMVMALFMLLAVSFAVFELKYAKNNSNETLQYYNNLQFSIT